MRDRNFRTDRSGGVPAGPIGGCESGHSRGRATSGFPGGCPIITATIEFDDRPGRLREHVFKVQGEWISGLSFAAELAIAEGHFREDCDTKQFAYELYSFMLGFHLYKRMLNDPGAMSKSVAAFDDLLYRNYSEEYKRQLKVTENREIYS